MLKHQKKFFNKIAETYHQEGIKYLKSFETLRKVANPHIKGDVMDVGNGGTIGYSIDKSKSLTLVDISENILKSPKIVVGKKLVALNHPHLQTVVADVMKLPFKRSKFDTVIMISTAHHLSVSSKTKTVKNINKAVKEIARVLKKDGIFVLSECHPNFILKFIQDLLFPVSYMILSLFKKPQPYFLSRYQTRNILKKHGFAIFKESDVPSGKRVYVPLFPSISPPGWLWDKLIESRLYIATKFRP